MSSDIFGLNGEVKIVSSNIRTVFTPHIPINDVSHFFGRKDEAARLVSVIFTPGQHILLYGDRGVGKTSLAKTTCEQILQKIQKGHFFEKRCDSGDTFESIFEEPLEECGVDFSVKEASSTHQEGGKAGANTGVINAGIHSKRERKITKQDIIKAHSPSWVAKKIKVLSGIMLIDEVDAIQSDEEKKKIAELIKILSDQNSSFKLVVVGIAKTGEELTAGHRSVERCLKEVPLKRMSDEELKMIILNGMNRLMLIPEDDVVDKIVEISAGFPHFTHLISLKCGEYALINNQRHITNSILQEALIEAVKDSEGALKRMYNGTLRKLNSPQEYKLLLLAASYCTAPEFRSSELRDELKDRFGVTITSKTLSRRLTKLTEGDVTTILHKPANGCFQFSDPRMPCFLKMALSKLDE